MVLVMTVAELIKELEKMPQDTKVKIDGGYCIETVLYEEHSEHVTIFD